MPPIKRQLNYPLPGFAEPIRPLLNSLFPPEAIMPVVGMATTSQTLIPKGYQALKGLARKIVGRDNFGFDTVAEAMANIRNHTDWAKRWIPETPAERDILEAWRTASLAEHPPQPSTWQSVKEYVGSALDYQRGAQKAATDEAAKAARRTFKIVE